MAVKKTPVALQRKWEKAFDALDAHKSAEAAARLSGLSPSTIYRFQRGDQTSQGLVVASELGRHTVGDAVIAKPLAPEVLAALEDFAAFRLRYMGRKSLPWQERAAYDMEAALHTKDREYLVVNCPPGSGKSTLFTHDIPCWLIARDRSIRIMVGARVEKIARMYVGRIKRTLEREAPMRTDAESLDEGMAFDAVATMQDDFGAFKPEGRSDLWRQEALVVRQLDGVAPDDKEPTVSAWGQDSGFLGGRFDVVVWDDLVANANTKTNDGIEIMREWYSTEAETRLEPGGVFVLQGQRIKHNDLYRYALDMKTLDGRPKYQHVVYQAHDDDKCQGHDNDRTNRPQPWPNGCLLDPYRLPWRDLELVRNNNPRVYEVQYQQRDGDRVGGLIEEAWINGGVDSSGYIAPGCLDRERELREVPEHLRHGIGWSFITVDPSPTEYWAVGWWVYDPKTTNRYLIDLVRKRMNPEDFLSMDIEDRSYSGVLEEMRRTANGKAAPISFVIFEQNAAQRWFLQQKQVQRWVEQTGIHVVGHTTTVMKADTKFGLESIGDLFRQGSIRLPHADIAARLAIKPLINEGLNYPDGETDDTLMMTWFAKLAVENLYVPGMARSRFPRPGGMDTKRGMSSWRQVGPGRGLGRAS